MRRRATKLGAAFSPLTVLFGALILIVTTLSNWFLSAGLPTQAVIIGAFCIFIFSFGRFLFFQHRIELENKRKSEKFLLDFKWNANLSPIEFEVCCAEYLKLRGWDASTTKSSGDHGADVIASRMGVSIVIQCKKYSKPVGSKAVQEAISGKAFHKTDYAFVISNKPYTKTAHELADQTKVLLLHFTSLRNIDNLVGLPEFKGKTNPDFTRQGRSVKSCPSCAAKLSLPSLRVGRVKCPVCSSSHYIETF
ncbi:MAG: restriction endonuclease [Acidiphilium sp.]|nr:restriction endonuclease [Acidiphilium sp.]